MCVRVTGRLTVEKENEVDGTNRRFVAETGHDGTALLAPIRQRRNLSRPLL
ncbi:hypothetical protein [Haladaptatus halobius]|uniref:hypothetical protein n=1 Tax=Haladaptatus halobius TaxID=2884875 RepID=UPI001D0AE2EA|nr:hypothetical protein [Haladaptatus halobius]